MAGEVILIVDDNPEIISLLEGHFEMRGYRVVTALDGREALGKVYQEKPDLIVLDIMMPTLSGYEICRTLKSNPETKSIPVVFLTARDEPKDVERGFDVEADGYVVKPFEPRELAEFVGDMLVRSRARG